MGARVSASPPAVRAGLEILRWIDLTRPLSSASPAFPGDPPIRVTRWRPPRAPAGVRVSRLVLGTHSGTHVDPPRHFFPGGRSVDRLDLRRLVGPAFVLRVDDRVGHVGAGDLKRVPQGTQRLLLRTANSGRRSSRRQAHASVSIGADAARAMIARRIRLVGFDALSVEVDPTGRYPVHRLLLGRGIPIVEGLRLGRVGEGPCWLACLPLRVAGGDGAPARVVVGVPRDR